MIINPFSFQKKKVPLHSLPMKAIQFTQSAKKAIYEMRLAMNVPLEYRLRIGTRETAGCLGITFLIGFDKKREDDKEFREDEIDILISSKHAMHVLGLEIDFEDRGNEKGFLFKNPKK